MTTPKIAINNLTVVYPGRGRAEPVVALDGISLRIADGELACIVGPSGCGKTTILRVLAGLEAATGGSAMIDQRDSTYPAKGMVFQGAGLFPWMTIEDNVAY